MKISDLGTLVATVGVDELVKKEKSFNKFIDECLSRYLDEDWGDLDDEDIELNNNAIKNKNDRLLAAYKFPKDNNWDVYDDKIWIITDADFSHTTILFPTEY